LKVLRRYTPESQQKKRERRLENAKLKAESNYSKENFTLN